MTTHPLPMTDLLYERFRVLIMGRSGLHFADDKRPILAKKLVQAAKATGNGTDLDEYLRVLASSPSTSPVWEPLVSELTMGETYFFRNKNHLDALAKLILPELVEQRKNLSRHIRIWSAGCATGEEPYSITILPRELIPDLDTWNILILATDINQGAQQLAAVAQQSQQAAQDLIRLGEHLSGLGKRYRL